MSEETQEGARQAREDHEQGRVSGPLEGLFGARNLAGFFAENMMNASRWRFRDMVSKFGKPVDRTEWDMTPQTYNAYYNPSNNEIVLPAAIFTIPGVPTRKRTTRSCTDTPAASTIGHEITHGFDDEGRQFDAEGNLKNWWTKDDEEQFKKRADEMVREFDAFEPLPGLHVNGEAALGENIADLGGILLGLDAFKKTEQYRKGREDRRPDAGPAVFPRLFARVAAPRSGKRTSPAISCPTCTRPRNGASTGRSRTFRSSTKRSA